MEENKELQYYIRIFVPSIDFQEGEHFLYPYHQPNYSKKQYIYNKIPIIDLKVGDVIEITSICESKCCFKGNLIKRSNKKIQRHAHGLSAFGFDLKENNKKIESNINETETNIEKKFSTNETATSKNFKKEEFIEKKNKNISNFHKKSEDNFHFLSSSLPSSSLSSSLFTKSSKPISIPKNQESDTSIYTLNCSEEKPTILKIYFKDGSFKSIQAMSYHTCIDICKNICDKMGSQLSIVYQNLILSLSSNDGTFERELLDDEYPVKLMQTWNEPTAFKFVLSINKQRLSKRLSKKLKEEKNPIMKLEQQKNVEFHKDEEKSGIKIDKNLNDLEKLEKNLEKIKQLEEIQKILMVGEQQINMNEEDYDDENDIGSDILLEQLIHLKNMKGYDDDKQQQTNEHISTKELENLLAELVQFK